MSLMTGNTLGLIKCHEAEAADTVPACGKSVWLLCSMCWHSPPSPQPVCEQHKWGWSTLICKTFQSPHLISFLLPFRLRSGIDNWYIVFIYVYFQSKEVGYVSASSARRQNPWRRWLLWLHDSHAFKSYYSWNCGMIRTNAPTTNHWLQQMWVSSIFFSISFIAMVVHSPSRRTQSNSFPLFFVD